MVDGEYVEAHKHSIQLKFEPIMEEYRRSPCKHSIQLKFEPIMEEILNNANNVRRSYEGKNKTHRWFPNYFGDCCRHN